MNELLREIQEDIRRERSQKLWHSFGRVMVISSVVIVLATIGIVVTQHIREGRAQERTAQLIKGIDRMKIEDYKGAIEVFDRLIENGVVPYDAIAALHKIQAQTHLGDKESAAETRKSLAGKKSGSDRAFADLARLMESGAGSEPSQDSPFYYTQSEWKAWTLVEEGKKEEAAALFAALRDDTQAPFTIRERARAALLVITPQLQEPKKAPADE